MVPALFWLLGDLPLTQNGKVDYSALARCCGERLPSGAAYVPPGTGMEHTVAAVWQEILAVEQVGLHENFFDIGGDSLRLTQMHWKLQLATGVKFSVTALFQYPTVKAFAKYLHEHCAGGTPAFPAAQSLGRPLGAGSAEDRAARQKAAMTRWKPVRAKGGRKHG